MKESLSLVVGSHLDRFMKKNMYVNLVLVYYSYQTLLFLDIIIFYIKLEHYFK